MCLGSYRLRGWEENEGVARDLNGKVNSRFVYSLLDCVQKSQAVFSGGFRGLFKGNASVILRQSVSLATSILINFAVSKICRCQKPGGAWSSTSLGSAIANRLPQQKRSSKLLQATRGRVTTRTYRGKLSPLRSTIIRICSPCASTIDLALRVHPVGCKTCAGRRGTSGIIEAMRSVCELLRWHNGSSRRVRQSECCARGR